VKSRTNPGSQLSDVSPRPTSIATTQKRINIPPSTFLPDLILLLLIQPFFPPRIIFLILLFFSQYFL
jgi:hypothetical protein